MRTRYLCVLLTAVTGLALSANGPCQEIEEFSLNLPDAADVNHRDRAGLQRDTWYFAGYQWITIGLLYVAPESVSGWTDEQKEGYDMSYWWDNVTHPEVDSDDFYINYILHPYWGAAYYVRARERGYNDREAFWYSVMLSSLYEFGAEALFEEPSIQDLIVTPVVGSMVGRYFMRVRRDIRSRDERLGFRSTRDRWLWTLTDPLGSLNQLIDRMAGRETELRIQPYRFTIKDSHARLFEPHNAERETVSGLRVIVRFE